MTARSCLVSLMQLDAALESIGKKLPFKNPGVLELRLLLLIAKGHHDDEHMCVADVCRWTGMRRQNASYLVRKFERAQLVARSEQLVNGERKLCLTERGEELLLGGA